MLGGPGGTAQELTKSVTWGEPGMKALSWIRARPKPLASAAGVTVGVIAITTMAFNL